MDERGTNMEIDILTLFPGMFAPLELSMIGRARQQGLVKIRIWDIRDFAQDRHRTVDDTPFGGGQGMILKPEPIYHAVEFVKAQSEVALDRVILMSPQGQTFTHEMAEELATCRRLALVCGHYEGIDERVRDLVVTHEISIGDYVLTGGELPAMVVVDAVCRLLPGVLGSEQGPKEDSFATGLLEYPHYTRPREFMGLGVPDVLLSGHHEEIRRWRRKEALRRTLERRPDLVQRLQLTDEDQELLRQLGDESPPG